MAAGSLYRALSRNQNLQPTADAIKSVVHSIRQKKTQSDLADEINRIKNLSATPSLDFIGDPTQRFEAAQNISTDALFGALQGGMGKQELGMTSDLFGGLVKGLKPQEPDLMQVDPYKELVDKATGETVRGAKEKPTTKKETPAEKSARELATFEEKERIKSTYKTKPKGESLSREKFDYQKGKDVKKASKEKRESQHEYNEIMGSKFYDIDKLRDLLETDDDGLVKEGILRKDDDKYFKNYGGAYVHFDKKGNPHVFKTDKELEDFAKKETLDIPDEWGRDQEDKYVEGKVYVDGQGNKAKYVNGKWEAMD